VPGANYLVMGAHSPTEFLPTADDLGCAYKNKADYQGRYYSKITGVTTATTTPMPCDPATAEYNTELFARRADNTEESQGTLKKMNDDGSEYVTNYGFQMTNNPFFRLYQPNTGDDVCTAEKPCLNVASREIQREALQHAQGAYFISIIVVQWADLLICKTRRLSIITQGMSNTFMNFGLMFETLLGAYLCYLPGLEYLGTRPLRFSHWMCAIPFSMAILLYDETRKYLMRATTKTDFDKRTGAIITEPGWIERNTYY